MFATSSVTFEAELMRREEHVRKVTLETFGIVDSANLPIEDSHQQRAWLRM